MIDRINLFLKNDLEDMICRMKLTYTEHIQFVDKVFVGAKTTGYTLPPGVYEFSGINLRIESLNPSD